MKLRVAFFPASLWKRVFAYIIDVFVINLIIVMPFQKPLEKMSEGFSNKGFLETYQLFLRPEFQSLVPKLLSIFLVTSLLSALYWAILEYKISQSVGKILMGIYVKSQGDKLTFWQCFLRNVTKVSTLPLVLDSAYMVLSKGYQRYFEKISRTAVVEQRYEI